MGRLFAGWADRNAYRQRVADLTLLTFGIAQRMNADAETLQAGFPDHRLLNEAHAAGWTTEQLADELDRRGDSQHAALLRADPDLFMDMREAVSGFRGTLATPIVAGIASMIEQSPELDKRATAARNAGHPGGVPSRLSAFDQLSRLHGALPVTLRGRPAELEADLLTLQTSHLPELGGERACPRGGYIQSMAALTAGLELTRTMAAEPVGAAIVAPSSVNDLLNALDRDPVVADHWPVDTPYPANADLGPYPRAATLDGYTRLAARRGVDLSRVTAAKPTPAARRGGQRP